MAVNSSVVAVGTSAGLVLTGAGRTDDVIGSSVLVANTGGVTVYLGGPGVTTSIGFPVAAGATVSIDMLSTDSLYAVAASAGQIALLQAGV